MSERSCQCKYLLLTCSSFGNRQLWTHYLNCITMKYLLLCLWLLPAAGTYAQTQMPQTTKDWINSNGLNLHSAGIIWAVSPGEQAMVLGETYNDTLWSQGSIKFYQAVPVVGGQAIDSLNGLALRYNVHYNQLEVLLDAYKDIKALDGSKVRYFSLEKNGKKSSFINAREVPLGKSTPGFYEVLAPGRLPLLYCQRTSVRKPTYNASLDVGDKYERISMLGEYVVMRQGKAEKWVPSRKNLLLLMQDQADELTKYLKDTPVDFKKRESIARVFAYYNQL
jgi:hypothetical protein